MIKHLKKILNDKSFIKQGERSKSVIKWNQRISITIYGYFYEKKKQL